MSIFGKSWDFHVTDILKATKEENLAMIGESVAYLKALGKTVVYDAEHFFDGYKNNREYALQTVRAAAAAGADVVSLCDTNGGCFPSEIAEAVRAVKAAISCPVGVHAHDDTGCGVANSVEAVLAGAEHVQGTLVGYGERCGNANLSAIIPDLQLKCGVAAWRASLKI